MIKNCKTIKYRLVYVHSLNNYKVQIKKFFIWIDLLENKDLSIPYYFKNPETSVSIIIENCNYKVIELIQYPTIGIYTHIKENDV